MSARDDIEAAASFPTRAREQCAGCGDTHATVSIEALSLGYGALERLSDFVRQKRWRQLVVVADANTEEIAGARVAKELRSAGFRVECVTFAKRHDLLADEAGVAEIRRAVVRTDADAAVAVGSGTLNDLTRYATFLEGRRYCSVPTAASMDGYASSVAAMQFGGVKVSFPAQTPVGIFAEPDIIAAAPREMAIWGFGDLAGKASSCFDWRLGTAITGEAYCALVESRVLEPLAGCVDHIEDILAGKPESISLLLSGLVASGIAMAMHGDSRPASGAEHHASHFWDLLAFRGLRKHAPHGLQVGYATGFVLSLEEVARHQLARPLGAVPGTYRPDEEAWFGELGSALHDVRSAKEAAFRAYAPRWPPSDERLERLDRRLAALRPLGDGVGRALRRAGIPRTAGFIDVDTRSLSAALRLANRIRSRFTVFDLLESQGNLDAVIEELLG